MLGHRYTSLWHMIAAPTVWALHFCVVYGWTAVTCARTGEADLARLGVGLATAVALIAIVLIGLRAWWQWDLPDDLDHVHDRPTKEDRREFLGHVGWLLSIVAGIGVIFVSLSAVFIGSCL